MSDVDYLVETEKEILLIEYKNADIEEAAHPERFNIKSDKKINNLVKKYYDSLHYLTLTKKGKNKRKNTTIWAKMPINGENGLRC